MQQRSRLKTRLQWQLRTLLALTALIAVCLALYINWVAPYRIQFNASAKLGAVGGRVTAVAAEPAWMSFLAGSDRFHRVVALRIEGKQITDRDIAPIVDLPFLERLYLNKTGIGDDGAKTIGQVTNLRRLSLWRTRLSDEGLPHIARCRNLQVLDLHECYLTDEGLQALEPLHNLRQLKLGGPICGPGLQSIAKLPQLARLDLQRTRVNFSSLAELAGSTVEHLQLDDPMPASVAGHLSNLRHLRNFHATLVQANDSTAKTISACSQLESLSLSGYELTDACLPFLQPLQRLKELRLHGNLTDDALRQLEAMPRLRTFEITGRFSPAAITRLAEQCPRLSGTICTIVSEDIYLGTASLNGFAAGKQQLTPLIQLRRSRYHTPVYGRLAPSYVEYAEIVYPATVADLANLRAFRNTIAEISLVNTPSLYRDYRYQRTWSLDGIDAFPNLQILSLPRVAHSDLARLKELPQLNALTIVDADFSDEDLEHLQLPEAFETLTLAPCGVTPEGLTRLQARYPHVAMRVNGHGRIDEIQRWQAPRIGQQALEIIAGYPQLQEVQLQDIRSPLDITPLARLPELERLELRGSILREPLFRLTAELPNLKDLFLASGKVTDRELEQLRYCPSLEKLFLSGSSVSDNVFTHLVHTPQLRELRVAGPWAEPPSQLGGTWITGRKLHLLKTCPQLTLLDLSLTHVGDRHLAELTSLTHLTDLRLTRTQIGDLGCTYLAQLPALEKLALEYTQVTDTGLAQLAKSLSLRQLKLAGTSITDAGLNHLPTCPTLEWISITRTKVTPQGRDTFKQQYPMIKLSP